MPKAPKKHYVLIEYDDRRSAEFFATLGVNYYYIGAECPVIVALRDGKDSYDDETAGEEYDEDEYDYDEEEDDIPF